MLPILNAFFYYYSYIYLGIRKQIISRRISYGGKIFGDYNFEGNHNMTILFPENKFLRFLREINFC